MAACRAGAEVPGAGVLCRDHCAGADTEGAERCVEMSAGAHLCARRGSNGEDISNPRTNGHVSMGTPCCISYRCPHHCSRCTPTTQRPLGWQSTAHDTERGGAADRREMCTELKQSERGVLQQGRGSRGVSTACGTRLQSSPQRGPGGSAQPSQPSEVRVRARNGPGPPAPPAAPRVVLSQSDAVAGPAEKSSAPRKAGPRKMAAPRGTQTRTAHTCPGRRAQPHVITHSCTDSRPQPHTRTPTSTRHHPYTNPSHCYRQGLLPPHQAARSPIQPGWECLEQQPGQGNSTELCQGRLRLDIKEPLCTGGWWARSSSPGQWVQP